MGTIIKYVGRTTDFSGSTLWEIVSKLRNFGVGRMLIRHMFQRYPESCYLRILKVEAMDEIPNEVRKVRVTVEKTWRGRTLPRPIVICSASYKADYRLVPIEDEPKYLSNTKKVQTQILPNKMELPPLLREFVKDATGDSNPMMDVYYKPRLNKFSRLADINEQPTIQFKMGQN